MILVFGLQHILRQWFPSGLGGRIIFVTCIIHGKLKTDQKEMKTEQMSCIDWKSQNGQL